MISRERDAIHTRVGVGLRSAHVAEIIARPPCIAWLEVHAENYMTGGPALRRLEEIRRRYPISLHGVGLSLGSADGIDIASVRRLRRLVEHIQPVLLSEHLAWSRHGGMYLNDLLPLPYTPEALTVVADNVARAQDGLGRTLTIENPSSYLRFHASTIPEAEFLAELTWRTGCRLLCDVNNIYVTAANLGLDPIAYLDVLPPAAIDEIHLAGHSANDADGVTILIDDHGSRVSDDVWALFAAALERFGPRPTLIEWDTDIPPLDVLLDEASRAAAVMAETVGGPSHALAR